MLLFVRYDEELYIFGFSVRQNQYKDVTLGSLYLQWAFCQYFFDISLTKQLLNLLKKKSYLQKSELHL